MDKANMTNVTSNKKFRIGVVIPTLNEEKNIAHVLESLKKIDPPIILVIDGGSTDKTVEVAKSFGAIVVSQNGKGKGDAIRQVFSNGYIDVDVFIMMDADCSMNPNEIPRFVKKLSSGFDLVKGSRFIKTGYSDDMGILRRIGNIFLITAARLLWGFDLTDLCYGYMAFSKNCVKKLAPVLKAKNFELETEVVIKAKKLGLRIGEVPSVELKRKHGRSKLRTFRDGFNILKSIVINSLISNM